MKQIPLVLFALTVLVSLSGCRSPEERARLAEEKKVAAEQKEKELEAAFKASVPADSPLAKLEKGMTEGEVIALLGPPKSQDTFATGKAYNPFNFSGRDTIRTVFFYEGIGRVEFSFGSWGQRNGAVQLAYDPEEPGYRRSR
jgi:outer membrane protein assembly factor BamE (lipoprotein component of BamABCDE complex)